MEGKSKYAATVLALFVAFVLVCGTWYLARTTAPEPWQVRTTQRPPAEDSGASGGAQDVGETRPDSLLPGEVIDVNTADVYDLRRLPGIGEKRAQDIVAWREEHGPFRTVDELTNVAGIGPVIVENLKDYVTTGSE